MRLNHQQSEIVDFPLNESTLVIAGAGSGKTTVLARKALRISSMLNSGDHLQMLTFSNQAAKEMKARVKRINSLVPENIKFDTFHSYGLRLMKSDPRGFGLMEDFSIFNDADVKRTLRALARDNGLPKKIDPADKKRLNPTNWLNTWSLCRQKGYDVCNIERKDYLCKILQDTHRLSDSEVKMAWSTLSGYEEAKQNTNSVDFDDLIFMPVYRMSKDRDFLLEIRKGLASALVDEAQDTNRLQYEMVKCLALNHCAVTTVGDDDQSIYGWRGAEIRNLKRFQHDFAAHDLRLEQNYRSTQSIVNIANRLIKHNDDRLVKTPFSEGAVGTDPNLFCSADSWQMASQIAGRVRTLVESGVKPKEISILYRTNRMAQLLEPAFRRERISYHVVGGMSLFDRAEVAAITNAVRLARNPRDTNALKSLIPYIASFGEASAYAVCDWVEENLGNSLFTLPDEIGSVPKGRMSRLKAFMDDLVAEALMSHSTADFIKWAVDGPMALLEREKDPELREKRQQYLELLGRNIDSELSDRKEAGETITWRDIAVEIALRGAGQTEGGDGQVTLSTLHRSKGLEWPYVLIAGVSEGMMPLDARSDLSDEDAGYSHMEEERRLGYVGITRGQNEVEFYHADRYCFPGSDDEKTYEPSRFLTEMGYTFEVQLKLDEAGVDHHASGINYSQMTNTFKSIMGMS